MKPKKTCRKPILILAVALIALLTFTAVVFAVDAYAKGDVTGDGKITAEDARCTLRAAVGLENYKEGSKEYNAANVDGVPGLSAADARLILRAAVGLEDLSDPAETKVYVIDKIVDIPSVLGTVYEQERERFENLGLNAYISEFFTCRLIVQATSFPDYSGYHPSFVIDGPQDYYLFQFRTEEEARAFQKDLENRDYVVFSEPDQVISLVEPEANGAAGDGVGADGSFNSWGVSYIQADQYANYLKSQNNTNQIVVAVVDTGVDNNHSYLKNKLVNGYDFIDGDNTPFEGTNGSGHGTHVSGTIIDCMPGLNVKIMPVRVLDLRGYGTQSTVALGIAYAGRSGAKVINLSLGGGHSKWIDLAINDAVSNGATVCVAAGNESDNTENHCPAHVKTEGCICVSALDSNGKIAYFSNTGNAVDVTAPGVSIYSCVPGGRYGYKSGTSMATPHVSAAAAMYKLQYPSASPKQIEQYVRTYTKDLYSSGWDKTTGYGVPQMSKALPTYTLTVSKDAGISSVSGGGSYAVGATVTVKATVSSGYTWKGWTSSNTGKVPNSSSQTYTFTMPASNVTLTATTTPAPSKYTLTVQKGTGISSVSGGGSYEAGASVTVTATVSSGYKWDKWTSSNTGLLANSASQTYTFKMPKGNVTLTASAAKNSTPSTKAEIINYYVAAYNRIGSDAKTIKRTFSSYTNYKNIFEAGNNGTIVNAVQALMNKFMVEDTSEVSGTVYDLPPKTVSTLSISTSQIDTATIKDNGSTYTIVLTSTGSDTNYEYNVQPGKGSAGVIGPLVDNNDIKEAAPKFEFTGLNTKYAKASVTATIDKATGHITRFDFDTPCVVYCTKVSYPVLGININVNNPQVGVEMKQTWKLTY